MSNLPPLNDQTFWAILNEEIDDQTVNQLLWYYLGYRFNDHTQLAVILVGLKNIHCLLILSLIVPQRLN
jgi:hypothetical protein